MNFAFRPMGSDDVQAMRTWRYPEPYQTYDSDSDPGDVELMLTEIASGERWFAVVDPATDELAGFFEFVITGAEIEIGLGLRPDLTGHGLGASLVEAGLAFAGERWAPRTFALDVFPWNQRAIKVYERAGFVRGDVYTRHFDGGVERRFLRMTRPAAE
ncbi:MAG: [ribosomal protein S18]-alanine N-acetyltransferase [Actinomycetota bacterium]|nr:[ribosomal protein S18]-alanine N-acetyltransferase [Actinomycetota bacterium]